MAGDYIAATAAAKQHIEEIRNKKFAVGNKEPNPLTEDLHHAVTSLSAELYTKDVHFLMELIQNSEDNAYPDGVQPTLEFVLTTRDITRTGAPSTLLVFNNEVGFSKKNMESICSVGRSTKKGKRNLGFIGEKVPEWVEDYAIVSDVCDIYGVDKILPTTTIILPLKLEKVEAVKRQLSDLHPELLLFLCKIKRLSVRGCSNDPNEAETVSAIFVSSETHQKAMPSGRANSCVVHLSAKEKLESTEETCQYFIWRQAFQVKPESKVSTRNDVDDWIISLAFPFGKRLKRGASSIGIFAFLPTAMVTNFPFVIHADFILASSREAILLDNKWNIGILRCVPAAFFNAFSFCVRYPVSSMAQAFEFLPARASSIPELNNIRESIKIMVQKASIIPCKMFGGKRWCKPGVAIRIQKKFRELLCDLQNQDISLKDMFSLKKIPLYPSLDLEKYNEVLNYIGVASDCESDKWYAQCIQTCNFILQASEDSYMKLLCFIATMKYTSFSTNFKTVPFLKYVNRDGEVKLHTCSSSKKILYAVAEDGHAWLTKWNRHFGCPGGMYFVPSSTQKALISHERSAFLRSWLSSNAGWNSCTVYNYALEVFLVLTSNNEPEIAIDCARFIYHSHSHGFIPESQLNYLCKFLPIVDGSGSIRKQMAVTLVPTSRSKWARLLGPTNPFLEQNYVDIAEAYAKSYQSNGEHTPEEELLDFLAKNLRAKDLPQLLPPDMVLPLRSCLTCEEAYLLLDWIRFLRIGGLSIPEKFNQSIRDQRWMKTYSCFSCPSQSFLLDTTEKIVFEMMKIVLHDFFILDQEFYSDRIFSYVDELKYLGVKLGFDDLQRLLANRFKSLTSSSLSKDDTYSLLMFISISREKKMLDEEWLDAIREGKWLQTSQGFRAPKESLFLQSETEVEAVLKITNLPVVDESFYGSKLSTFSSELTILGVMLNIERVYDLIAQNLTFPVDVTSITGDCGLLILRCIRYMGSSASGFIDNVTDQPWLKTNSGFESPLKCILRDGEWDSLFSIVDVPIIDEGFYGDEIKSFKAEMKAIGVAVDFDGAFQMIIAQFKLLSSSHSLTPANIISLLICVRDMIQKRPSQLLEFHSSLLGEKWLKTRHGYRAPKESILFSSKWEGAGFVARGLKQPVGSGLITRDSAISLLECINCLMSKCNDQNAFVAFLDNLKRSKWLKTTFGYSVPEQCILFDPTWEGVLERTDVPSLDEDYYNADFSVFKNELRVIDVKVDPGEVCCILLRILSSKTETSSIVRMYWFLSGGEWISSRLLVLCDKYQLFGSRLYALEDYYPKELLPMFTSIFGVAKFPSTDDYMQLWNDWDLRSTRQVTAVECFSFFAFFLDNFNPCILEALQKNLTKLPATTGKSEKIYLVSKEEVFLPDDLQLKRIFENAEVPLFTWFPSQSNLSPVTPWRLNEVYNSIGVRKISESVVQKVDHPVFSNYKSKMFADSRNGLFAVGLLKIILAFLAGPMMKMPAKERHKAAKSLLELSVFETDKAIQVNYQLLLSTRSRTLEAQRSKMVFWDRSYHKLILNRSGFEDRKANIEFVSSFAQEVAEGVLSQGPVDAIYNLSKLLQIGFMFEFKEDAVEFLLIKESLKLFVEDTEFLNAEFGKRTHPRSEQLGPLTPIPSSKKRCQ
ncbi:hypothetical protein CCACVL1_00391 [Corchorus capsularis]|uniref:Uncharacterized protein n=1 Tax=Corchorus capsularis TaxID=210143 RepID=A0A1R3KX18_COCAP|nr:hypothetical protein CCACVL1_00391 [Corchorus capsularis]